MNFVMVWGDKDILAPQAIFFVNYCGVLQFFGALIVDFFLSQLGLPDLFFVFTS
jgi:hypothetical protein